MNTLKKRFHKEKSSRLCGEASLQSVSDGRGDGGDIVVRKRGRKEFSPSARGKKLRGGKEGHEISFFREEKGAPSKPFSERNEAPGKERKELCARLAKEGPG